MIKCLDEKQYGKPIHTLHYKDLIQNNSRHLRYCNSFDLLHQILDSAIILDQLLCYLFSHFVVNS